MQHKLNITFVITTVVLLILNIVQFITWRNINMHTAETYTASIADLNATLARYGPDVTCYTVRHGVKAGDLITADSLETFTIPQCADSEQYVHDTSDIVNKYFKIAVNPGTPVTTNMTMEEDIDDSARDRDIVLDRITVGLKAGDYIDIRMTMPYGDDYVVLSHKRINEINENTIKLNLNEQEWAIYQGALIDYYLNQQYGVTLYGDRYIEPGVQNEAIAYYAVPENIAALIQKNPNIISDERQKSAEMQTWRDNIDNLLLIFRDEQDTIDSDASLFSAGRMNFNTAINTDRQAKAAEEETNDTEIASDESYDNDEEEVGDDFWEDTVE